jgi:sugar lactone lactonase YvrE
VLLDAGGNVIGETLISGTGLGGLAVVVPGNAAPFAGNGTYLDPVQDNIPPLTAELNTPTSIAKNGAGDLYIADSGHNRIRIVSASTGLISTIAGTGTASYTGDTGPAAAATLNSPSGVAVDGAGNLYIADTGNNVIRKVDASTQIITTIAGSVLGQPGYGGDGTLATSGTVLLNGPQTVTLDPAGNIYIADTRNQVIRKINASDGTISTVAGNYTLGTGVGGYNGDGIAATAAMLNNPYTVAFDPLGNMLIADTSNDRIRLVDAGTGLISTVVGTGTRGFGGDNGPATSAELSGPTGIAVDPAGNYYIGDTYNSFIRKVNFSTKIISTIASRYTEYLDPSQNLQILTIDRPQGVFFDAKGNLFFANTFDMRVWELQGNLAAIDFTGTPVRQGSLSTTLSQPVENDGNAVLNPEFTSFNAAGNAQHDPTTGAGICDTATPLAFDNQCAIGVIFSPAATPLLTANTTETGTVTAPYTTVTGVDGPNSPLSIVAIGVALPLNSTTTTITANPDPSLFGQNVTFTVQVTTGAGTGVPTGTVNIVDSPVGGVISTLASGLPLDASGVATFSTSTLSVGIHYITAYYSGDASHPGSTSIDNGGVPWTQIVEQRTNVSLVSSANPSRVGQSVTFTAAVTEPAGGGVPSSGTISFLDGNTTLFSGPIASGVLTFTTSALANGLHPITAIYSGDLTTQTLGATSAVLNQVVQAQATLALSSSANPSFYGNPVTFTATIASAGSVAAGGTVAFFDAGVQIGTGTLNALNPDIATFTSPTLSIGVHNITATYAGDNYNSAAVASPLSQVVKQAATVTTVTAVPNPSTYLQTVAFAASVIGTSGVPTGTVQFYADGALIGASALNTNGVASITYSNLAIGAHIITATYLGDTGNATSTSAQLTLNVGKIPTTTGLGSATTTGANPKLNLVATVVGAIGPVPTGTVTFTNAAATLGTATLDATGVAVLNVNLATGTYVVQAAYSGDATHLPSTSLSITITANPVTFNLSVTPPTVSLKTTQYTNLGIVLTSVGGFTDTVGMGCAALPVAVTCHFSSPTVDLASNGTATVQLALDTNSPLTGGSLGSNIHPGTERTYLASLFFPISLLFGFLFWRSRRSISSIFTAVLLIALSAVALAVSGCSGITTKSATPGTYTISVVATGQKTGVVESQNIVLTITQ